MVTRENKCLKIYRRYSLTSRKAKYNMRCCSVSTRRLCYVSVCTLESKRIVWTDLLNRGPIQHSSWIRYTVFNGHMATIVVHLFCSDVPTMVEQLQKNMTVRPDGLDIQRYHVNQNSVSVTQWLSTSCGSQKRLRRKPPLRHSTRYRTFRYLLFVAPWGYESS